MCRSEDNLLESSFSFHHVDPGTELWLSDWGKHGHPLSHHAGLCFKLLDWASQSLSRFLRSLKRSSAVSAEHWSSSNSPTHPNQSRSRTSPLGKERGREPGEGGEQSRRGETRLPGLLGLRSAQAMQLRSAGPANAPRRTSGEGDGPAGVETE